MRDFGAMHHIPETPVMSVAVVFISKPPKGCTLRIKFVTSIAKREDVYKRWE